MTAFRVQAKRTTASGPPADLEFGELAYSDADQKLYVGRPEGAAPTTFQSNTGSVDEAIALINTEQDSQDAAIAALAAASSGQSNDIATLQARPIAYGFTYDQQAEPVGPAAGQTWRERSAGGLIIGEWEWSAIHAVWLDIRAYDIPGLTITGSGAVSSGVADYEEKRRLINYVVLHVVKASGTFDAANNSTITPLLTNAEGTIVLNNQAYAIVTTTAGYLVTKKSAVGTILTPARSRISRSSVGSPGTTVSWFSINCRDVRP